MSAPWSKEKPATRTLRSARAKSSRTAEPTSTASLHAKCIVVDDRRALVTSANFTSRGQERNVEVGVLVESEKFARELVHQWRNAAEAGVFRQVVDT